MEKISGLVERITFHNEEDRYTVLKLRIKGYSELVTVIGNVSSVHVGSVLLLQGEWKNDKQYGKQFRVTKFEESLPASVYGIEKYLGSGLIKGIGPSIAKKIVKYFKKETLSIIESSPDRLNEIPNLGKKRVELIKKAWQEQKEIKNVMLFLQQYDVSTALATKIFKTYGEESISIVKENPYRLADDIAGIGFKTADILAQKVGIDKESYFRCRAGVLYTLNTLSNEGHCYANLEQLVSKAVELLDIEDCKIVMTFSDMIHQKELIVEQKNERIYLPPLFYSEFGVAKLIIEIMKASRLKKIETKEIVSDGLYDEIQQESIRFAAKSKFMVLTGGPGTGKTTTTKGIISIFQQNNFDVVLAAPTGRAAKRMSDATGMEAKTIHRLLEFKPPQGYQKGKDNPLKGDVLIIDESSMIDIVLMYNLLKAVPSHMTVILVGDVDQLPSVGPGNVFRDIINSGVVPVVKLKKIYRQAENSNIIENAHKINKGIFPALKNGKNSDFFFIEQFQSESTESTLKLVVDLYSKRLPKKYKLNMISDIQVLVPMRKGVLGTENINTELQKAINHSSMSMYYGGEKYHPKDKVMQMKNNYNKEIYNGDIGIVSRINLDDNTMSVNFDGKEVKYEQSELDEITLAYASTIHKAQGAEFPVVVMILTNAHFKMLQRNLLYTGVTRAKSLFVLVGEKEAIQYAVNNNSVQDRNTYLSKRLKEMKE